jgi:Putative prokaryotic signal transducing protein
MTEPPTTEEHDPPLTEHDFVKIASAHDQAQAEFVQGLLHEEGVPSWLRRSPGSDVPGFLVAGQRDVLVQASSVEVARDVLRETEREPLLRVSAATRRPPRVRAWLLIAAAFAALVVCVAVDLVT